MTFSKAKKFSILFAFLFCSHFSWSSCQRDSDCGQNLLSTESCTLLAPDNKICNGKQDVQVRCENNTCTRYLGQCQFCQWSTLPVLPHQCEADKDCATGQSASESCSMVRPDNTRCVGTMSVRYQCNARTNGQKKCDRMLGPCNDCR